ncbi:MAG: thioredoxin family protein [Desulfomonile tiedjei]|nr:thioredoxin family protein [Desulfomonile tiedjei]
MQAIEEIAPSHESRSDAEVQQALLLRLGKKNYIPGSAREDYGRAFTREFRKHLGQPYDDPVQGSLRVVVLGPGCSQCNRLEQAVMQALTELDLPASLEHVTDIKEITTYGFIPTPALLINGNVVAKGTVPSKGKIKDLLAAAADAVTMAGAGDPRQGY